MLTVTASRKYVANLIAAAQGITRRDPDHFLLTDRGTLQRYSANVLQLPWLNGRGEVVTLGVWPCSHHCGRASDPTAWVCRGVFGGVSRIPLRLPRHAASLRLIWPQKKVRLTPPFLAFPHSFRSGEKNDAAVG